MSLQAIVHPAEEGGFWAEVPALPGCVTQGETLEEIKARLLEAIEGWIEVATEQALQLASPDCIVLAIAA